MKGLGSKEAIVPRQWRGETRKFGVKQVDKRVNRKKITKLTCRASAFCQRDKNNLGLCEGTFNNLFDNSFSSRIVWPYCTGRFEKLKKD